MTTELYWLTLTALMTALFWLPYVFNRMVMTGLVPTLAGSGPDIGKLSQWAQRAVRAHHNAIENLAIFAPVVLTAHLLGVSSPATKAAAAAYVFARLVHFAVYAAGIPLARTLAFAAGWATQITFIASILHWI